MAEYQVTITTERELGQFAEENIETYLKPMAGGVNVEIEKVDD